jgi:type IV secretory pathway TraG/TraD family ATPase VirD4
MNLRGTRALEVGWLITAVPLWVGLFQGRAPFRKWLLSPITAVIWLFIAGIVAEVLRWLLERVGIADRSTPAAIVTLTCFVIIGYAGGRLSASSQLPEVHKRGAVLEDGAYAQRESSKLKRRYDLITLAGVAVAPEDETKHFKLIGTTGTGKSTAIRELLRGALSRGDRAVIADPDGGYVSNFFDAARDDVILNPFDERSVKWDLFTEIREPYDVEQLASALIPAGEDASGREWRGYARTFFTAVVRRCRADSRDLAELWRLLTVASGDELRPIVAGTPAQPFLEPDNGKMFGSLRSVVGSAIAALEYIQTQHGAAFSVKEWVRSGRGVLFVPYQAGQIAALRSVIAAWLRLAIFEAMSGKEGDQRLWFIVDELDALGTIDGLKDALARLRKFGGRCVLGFQSIAQVSSTYGAGEAQTIVENCSNTLILRCSGSEHGGTSRFASNLIGEREIVRAEYSRGQSHAGFFSKGTHNNVSDNVSYRHVREPAVLASEIEQLPDLAGFLKLASSPSWLRVVLTPPSER